MWVGFSLRLLLALASRRLRLLGQWRMSCDSHPPSGPEGEENQGDDDVAKEERVPSTIIGQS